MERIRPNNQSSYFEEYKVPRHYSVEGPPSPATSGYSELDSEPDTHDSGRVSEMEDSPKVAHYARPQCIPCRSGESRRSSVTSNETSNRARSSKRQSRLSKLSQQQDNESKVVIDRRVLRALLLYVRESRLRLDETEAKLSEMQNAMDCSQRNHEQQLLTVVKCITSLKNLSRPHRSPPACTLLPEPTSEPTTPSKPSISGKSERKGAEPVVQDAAPNKERRQPDPPIDGQSSSDNTVKADATTVEDHTTSQSITPTKLNSDKSTRDQQVSQNEYNQESSVESSTSAQTLYAVVKKKPKPLRYSGARYSLQSDDTQSHLLDSELSFVASPKRIDTNSSFGNASEQLEKINSVRAPSSSEAVESNQTSYFSGLESAGVEEMKPSVKKRDREVEWTNKTSPFSSSSAYNASKPSSGMLARSSGDGFYISDHFRHSDSNNLCKNNSERITFDGTPATSDVNVSHFTHKGNRKHGVDFKGGVLLSKFKRKLKDTKKKVSHASSKESILSENLCEQVNPEFEVIVNPGKDNISSKIFLPDSIELQKPPKSYISYSSVIRHSPECNIRKHLDSTGDSDSRRSTDASDNSMDQRYAVVHKPFSNGSHPSYNHRSSTDASNSSGDQRYAIVKKPSGGRPTSDRRSSTDASDSSSDQRYAVVKKPSGGRPASDCRRSTDASDSSSDQRYAVVKKPSSGRPTSDRRRSLDTSDRTSDQQYAIVNKPFINSSLSKSTISKKDSADEELPTYSVVIKPSVKDDGTPTYAMVNNRSSSRYSAKMPSRSQPDSFGRFESDRDIDMDRAGYCNVTKTSPYSSYNDRVSRTSASSAPTRSPNYSRTLLSTSSMELPQTVSNVLYRPSEVEVTNDGNGVCDSLNEAIKKITGETNSDDVFFNNGVILNDVTHQQNEIRRFETGMSRDEAPPKPSRVPTNTKGGYAPQASGSHYPPTSVQPGLYSQSIRNNLPIVPPKTGMKIMTPEELANHEAQVKLRQRQMAEASLEQQLALQREQAEEDDKWIRQEEQQMHNPEIPSPNGDSDNPDHMYSSADDAGRSRSRTSSKSGQEAPLPPSIPPAKPPRTQMVAEHQAPPKAKFEEVKPTPTMKLDREGDNVYRDTMSVVKSVLATNHETMDAKPDQIFVLVRNIGKSLKDLCTSLEQEMPNLPDQFHREVDMAQKTTNKDLSQIINQMKLVKKFYATTQVAAYKKCLMAAAQILAMDAKNLLDVVDKARIHKLQAEHDAGTSQSPPETSEVSAGSGAASSSDTLEES